MNDNSDLVSNEHANIDLDDHQALLDMLNMDEETFNMLDLHKPEMLEGLLKQEFGEGMIRYYKKDDPTQEG